MSAPRAMRKNWGRRSFLGLWLGSSIGNFTHMQAVEVLSGLADFHKDGDVLLIGFDLLKDPALLVAAYSDERGVTAEFNYNLLRRINRELRGNFDLAEFVHHATFLPDQARMESFLISKKHQVVTIAGHAFAFDAWSAIHTEVSCKYSEASISELLCAAGLRPVAWFMDDKGQFVDVACSRG